MSTRTAWEAPPGAGQQPGTEKQVSPLSSTEQTTGLLECLSTKLRCSENNCLSFEGASQSTTWNSSYQVGFTQTRMGASCTQTMGQKARGKQGTGPPGWEVPLCMKEPQRRDLSSASGTSQCHLPIQDNPSYQIKVISEIKIMDSLRLEKASEVICSKHPPTTGVTQ